MFVYVCVLQIADLDSVLCSYTYEKNIFKSQVITGACITFLSVLCFLCLLYSAGPPRSNKPFQSDQQQQVLGGVVDSATVGV